MASKHGRSMRFLDDGARRRELLLVFAGASVLLYALVLRIDPAVVPPQWDEFIFLTNARRLFEGQRPFVDYVWFLPPAGEALYATWFHLTGGASAGSARLLAHFLVVTTALCWYFTLRSLGQNPRWAASGALALPLLYFPVWGIPLHHWTACFFLSVAALLLVRGLLQGPGPRSRWLLAMAGCAWALCALAVQTHGVVGAALLLGLWWHLRSQDHPGARYPPLRGQALSVAAGASLPIAVLGIYLVSVGAVGTFVQAAVLYVFGNYHQKGGVNDLGFLSDLPLRMTRLWTTAAPLWIRAPQVLADALTPIATLLLCLLAVAIGGKTALQEKARQRSVHLWFVPVLALTTVVMWSRPDVMHLAFYGTTLAVVCWVSLWQSARRGERLARWGALLWLGMLGTGAVSHHLLTLVQGASPVPVFHRMRQVDPALEGLPWVDARMIASSPLLMQLRRTHLQFPQFRLFAVPEGAVPYFLSMPPAVPDTLLLPATARYDGPVEYERTRQALLQRPADVLVLVPWEQGRLFLEPPAWADDRAKALADFLVENYVPLAQIGQARVYVLKGAQVAPSSPTLRSATATVGDRERPEDAGLRPDASPP
ncbi:MAG: hypothetical protein ABIJ09_10615 [Pseudomonadota bacterium]